MANGDPQDAVYIGKGLFRLESTAGLKDPPPLREGEVEAGPREFTRRHLGGVVRFEPVVLARGDVADAPVAAVPDRRGDFAAALEAAMARRCAEVAAMVAASGAGDALPSLNTIVEAVGALPPRALEMMVSSLLRQIGNRPPSRTPFGAESFESAAVFVDPQPDIPPPTKSEPMPARALRAPRTQRIGVFLP